MTISEENLKAREGRIGSSDAGCIMGEDDYRQPVDLWMQMTKRLPNTFQGNMATFMGDQLEAPLGEAWAEMTGHTIDMSDEIGQKSHIFTDEHYEAISHIDGLVLTGEYEGWIVEVKNRNVRQAASYGDSGGGPSDIKPVEYWQIQHHCLCGGWPGGILVVYLGGADLRWFAVPRDEQAIADLISEERKFMAHVKHDERPSLDYKHSSTREYLDNANQDVSGEVIALGNRGQMLHQRIVDAGRSIKSLESDRDAAKAELRDILGEAYAGELPDGGYYRRKFVEGGEFTVNRKDRWDMRHVKKI